MVGDEMANDIRLIAVDLDGTLLNSKKQISDEDRAALAEAAARGIRVVPTTGRNYSFALPVLESLGFATTMVCSNGAIIRSSRGETHFQRLLPRRIAREVLKVSREFHQFAVLMYDGDGPGQLQMLKSAELPKVHTFTESSTPPTNFGLTTLPKSAESAENSPLRSIADSAWAKKNFELIETVKRLEVARDSDPLEILYAGPVAAMRELIETLRAHFAGMVFEDAPAPDGAFQDGEESFCMMRTEYPAQDFSMLDVIHAQCSKGRALAQLGQSLGIAREQVMAIGDNFNDLDMLEFAGLAVVMGNATSEFQQDTVTRRGWQLTHDCDSSGVAHALRTHVL